MNVGMQGNERADKHTKDAHQSPHLLLVLPTLAVHTKTPDRCLRMLLTLSIHHFHRVVCTQFSPGNRSLCLYDCALDRKGPRLGVTRLK